MNNKSSVDLQKFLLEKLLNLPKNQRLNSKAFMLEAFEMVMQSKTLSKKALAEIYNTVLPTCHDPFLMKKLFGKPGASFSVSCQGRRTQG